MKKLAIYSLLALGLAAATVSCSDKFLDVEYYSIVNPDGVYEDADNVFMGLTGVYSILYATSDYYIKPHPALANLPTLDLQADGWDAEMSKHAWGVESKSAFFENAWKYSYRMVSRANLYLADLENVTDDVVPEATRKIYESEARCLRGTAYYYLTINFSRVPMLMTGETYATSPEKARPESDEEAWKTIRDDFEYAAQYLDWQPAGGMLGRFTKAGALAYAAKANMYIGDFEKAKTQLKDIIDHSGRSLNPVHGMIHWQDYVQSCETIWEVSFPLFPKMGWDIWSFAKNNDNRYFSMQTKAAEYGGWGDSPLSYELVRSFEPGDKRRTYNIVGWHGTYGDTNPYTGDVIGSKPEFQKYFQDREGIPNNHSLKWWKTNDVYSAHSVQLYRYTEVLLNYAECCFRTNEEAEGWRIIAEVRNRAWGNLEVGYDPNANSNSAFEFPTELLNTEVVEVPDAQTVYAKYKADKGYKSPLWVVALTQERRKEFMYEFSLWYDLSRMNLIEEWLDCEYPKNGKATFYNTRTGKYYVPSGNDFNEPYDKASADERADMIPVTPRDWDWNPIHLRYPIPTSELTANPLCEQNEGYE